ncbi:hypothetical protein AAFF_G00212930 [Aldrovandia affinis]|uniref:Uncharacterized protein n=1 Tax=Aldrovandia affinis TaxID=143900 RepID=A0AAD7W5T2_9TELE|nr:hypothetical protein AAFF_G00212930 [Aldrovandia affinis]
MHTLTLPSRLPVHLNKRHSLKGPDWGSRCPQSSNQELCNPHPTVPIRAGAGPIVPAPLRMTNSDRPGHVTPAGPHCRPPPQSAARCPRRACGSPGQPRTQGL